MSSALDQGARTALERFVQRARRLLEEDLAREAEGRFGIHVADGEVEDEEGLHLDPAGVGARRDVVEILDFLRREEPTGAEAVSRLIREAAFTHLNRLVAIRIAEAIQLLPESLAKGSASTGFKELLEVAPLLAHDASGGYWRYLQLCGDELAADLPQLFDPRNPLLELAPSPAAFDDLVEMVGATDLDPVWDAPDALGWVYQFFNSGDERRAMRDASASPRNSRELAVRNQFFTPRYVVDFLVHNSLGRRLLEADPTSGLEDHLPMLLDPPTELGEPLALSDVRVLDPACGSGHFLLGAYDVLERAWELQGVSPEDAAPHIVSSLWGIDIDARCAQVAAAAVILRARRFCKTHGLPAPNIITARALPEPAEGWDALLASLPPDRRQLVASIRDALDRAPVLGPLLKVEELLATEIRSHVVGADEDPSTLFGAAGIADDAFGRAETDVLQVLQGVADRATSGPAHRLFAAEAQDAIRFVEAMRHRYDAVLMNPPFGEAVTETKGYLQANYSSPRDLFAPFVERGLALTKPETGRCGAITSRAGMFLTTLEPWRSAVLIANQLESLVDLGNGVMEQALVESAAYVVRNAPANGTSRFVRLLKDRDRALGIEKAIRNIRAGLGDERVFVLPSEDLAAVPGSALAYWLDPAFRSLFTSWPSLEESIGAVRHGLSSGDDFRFVRAQWEVLSSSIGCSRSESTATTGKRWFPLAKGGEYAPFFGDPHLLIDWMSDGEAIRKHPGSAVRNPSFYFRPGLTWTRRTASRFAVRLFPGGVFSEKGDCIFVADDDRDKLLALSAWLNTRHVTVLMNAMVAAGDQVTSGGAAKSYEMGRVQRLPWVQSVLQDQVVSRTRRSIELRMEACRSDETSGRFRGPCIPQAEQGIGDLAREEHLAYVNRVLELVDLSGEVDALVSDSLHLGSAARAYLDSEVSPHPANYPYRSDCDEVIADLYGAPIESVIGGFLESGGGSAAIANLSHVADRRVEVLAHGLQVHPRSGARVVAERGRLPPGSITSLAQDLMSYLVGCAVGRWDPGQAADPPAAERSDPLMWAGCRMLQVPTQSAGMLVDEPGHTVDIEAQIFVMADRLLSASDRIMSEVVGLLGATSVRQYIRSKFFKAHLSKYSRSGRKAPIYWPLAVPSGHWGVWIHAPSLSREVLYAVASEALRREGHAQAELRRLEAERIAGGSGRGAKALDKVLDSERKLAEELRRFREEAERIAGLGWEPDLNDGIVLCAAPLADLFPAWKEPAQCRKELRAGKYEWSMVSKWADQL